jgi:hypothetical protein
MHDWINAVRRQKVLQQYFSGIIWRQDLVVALLFAIASTSRSPCQRGSTQSEYEKRLVDERRNVEVTA